MALVSLVFGKGVSVSLEPSQQQQGGSDCGVFAIATCTALAHGITPLFNQEKMRQHLIQCFENSPLFPHEPILKLLLLKQNLVIIIISTSCISFNLPGNMYIYKKKLIIIVITT